MVWKVNNLKGIYIQYIYMVNKVNQSFQQKSEQQWNKTCKEIISENQKMTFQFIQDLSVAFAKK